MGTDGVGEDVGSVQDKVKRGREKFLRGGDVRRRESAGMSCKCRAAKGRDDMAGKVPGWKDKKEEEDVNGPPISRKTQPVSGSWLDVQPPLWGAHQTCAIGGG